MNDAQDLTTPLDEKTFIAPPNPFWRLKWACLRLSTVVGIDLMLLAAMTGLLMTVTQSVHGEIRWLHHSLYLPFALMFFLVFIDLLKFIYYLVIHRRNTATHFLRQIPVIFRDWLPFLLIDLMYENLHDLTPHLLF